MRALVLALGLPLLSAPAAASSGPARDTRPWDAENATAQPDQSRCRDTIQAVRAERGLSAPNREGAIAQEPEAWLFHALDTDIDGCDVLVMVGNPRDIRQLPERKDDGRLFRPIPSKGQ